MAACDPRITGKVGTRTIATDARAIIADAATIQARLRRVRSIRAPAGVWAITEAIPIADIAMPIFDGSQCFVAR